MTQIPTPRGFRGAFRTDTTARALYAEGAGIFRILPAAVAVPEHTDDLLALVSWARETGAPLVPRGAGSGMPGGNVGHGVVVDLTRGFRRGPLVDVDAKQARAGAGVTWHAVDDAAASAGLFLPPNPSSGRFCTIGGMTATNAAGARSYKYGAMRQWVDAVDFVTTEGETGKATRSDPARGPHTAAEDRLLRDVAPWLRQHQRALESAAPATRKNSSGYRLANNSDDGWVRHLLIGSEGTLAFITGVELRLAPRPQSSSTLLVPVANLAELPKLLDQIDPLAPAAIELLDRTYLEFVRALGADVPSHAEAVLIVELEDESQARTALLGWDGIVRATDDDSKEEIWRLRHRASPILAGLPDHQRSLQVVEDGCVPRERLGEYITGLRRLTGAAGFPVVIFGHAGDGHVHANVLADVREPDLAARLERCLREASALQIELGGTTSGEHGDGRLRASFLEAQFGATYLEACRRVKAAFDPGGMLNPGVKLMEEEGRTAEEKAPALISADVLKVGEGRPTLPPEIERLLRKIEKEAQWDVDRLSLIPAESPV